MPGRSAGTPRSPGRSASRGSFHPDLTGAQNVRFVARIYGIDTDALIAYVEDFAELGDFMDMPVRSYSSGMRARLAFGMSMGIAFDWYLVDEITAVGDTAFKEKSLAVFKHRLKDAGLLMTSHSPAPSAATAPAASCSRAAEARYFDDVEAAIAAHERQHGLRLSPGAARPLGRQAIRSGGGRQGRWPLSQELAHRARASRGVLADLKRR